MAPNHHISVIYNQVRPRNIKKEQTWFWNSNVDEAIRVKRKCFKAYSKLRRQKLFDDSYKTAKEAHHVAKKQAKFAV